MVRVFRFDLPGARLWTTKARRSAFGSALIGLLIIASGVASDAFATHQVDHRYNVVGEVRTEDGKPVAGENVKVTAGNGQLITETRTDAEGRYRILLHLHNTDLGKAFDVVVRDRTRTARVQFDPHDAATERGLRLDFVISDEPAAAQRPRILIAPNPQE